MQPVASHLIQANYSQKNSHKYLHSIILRHHHHTALFNVNDAVEILIMTLNRQIISWSINHQSRRIEITRENLFASDFITERLARIVERKVMSAQIQFLKVFHAIYHQFICINIVNDQKRVQNSLDDLAEMETLFFFGILSNFFLLLLMIFFLSFKKTF